MATPIPTNEARFGLADLLAATGGQLLPPTAETSVDFAVSGIATDTRSLRRGEAFVALSGERFDGHGYLGAAAEKGARVAVVERVQPPIEGLIQLQVASSLEALGALAVSHLRRWRRADPQRRVVALTGSAGKTTTKQALQALLTVAQPEPIHAARGNLNNLIGVPMTLLGLTSSQRYAVLELGTNSPGEIPRLAAMTQPNVAIVTLVAAAHTEGLGDLDAVAREKGALFQQLSSDDGCAIANLDDALVSEALLGCPAARRIGYGETVPSEAAAAAIDDHYRVARMPLNADGRVGLEITRRDGSVLKFGASLLGRAGALAAAAAVAAVEAVCGIRVTADHCERAFNDIHVAGRLQLKRAHAGVLLLDDSYNSNPASAAASVEFAAEFARSRGRRLVLVLGEMRELGEQSPAAHRTLGEQAAASGAEVVVAVGGDARHLLELAGQRSWHFCEDARAAATTAVERVAVDDVVLIKGSRGVATEVVVDALMAAHGGEAAP